MADERFDVQQLQVASPCYVRWSDMRGDERVRHCASCQLNVFNVRELTTAEVEALLQRTNGRLCLRLYRRWDGTVLTRDCPVGVQRARVRLAAALMTAAAFAGVLLLPLLRLGSPRRDEDEYSTFQERVAELKWRAYEWPVIGAVLEELDPRPQATMGVVIRRSHP